MEVLLLFFPVNLHEYLDKERYYSSNKPNAIIRIEPQLWFGLWISLNRTQPFIWSLSTHGPLPKINRAHCCLMLDSHRMCFSHIPGMLNPRECQAVSRICCAFITWECLALLVLPVTESGSERNNQNMKSSLTEGAGQSPTPNSFHILPNGLVAAHRTGHRSTRRVVDIVDCLVCSPSSS